MTLIVITTARYNYDYDIDRNNYKFLSGPSYIIKRISRLMLGAQESALINFIGQNFGQLKIVCYQKFSSNGEQITFFSEFILLGAILPRNSRRGPGGPSPLNRNATNNKNLTKKPCFFCFSFFAILHTAVHGYHSN